MFVSSTDFERADWPLLKNGSINLFISESILEEAKNQLRALEYEVADVSYDSVEGFRLAMTNILQWQDQFGYSPWNGNLDALVDAFVSFPFPPSKAAAICVTNYDKLNRDDAGLARVFLDIIEYQSRNYLLRGCRLIALIQTNDPSLFIENLGARSTHWNQKELFLKDRGLA
jgi:hypothetical protein